MRYKCEHAKLEDHQTTFLLTFSGFVALYLYGCIVFNDKAIGTFIPYSYLALRLGDGKDGVCVCDLLYSERTVYSLTSKQHNARTYQ